jgi:hypothetical protein
MKPAILVFMALWSFATTSNAETLTWTLQNSSGEFALVRFFSQSRNVMWPAYDRAYNLPADGEGHVFPLTCFAGEYICYGAWVGRLPDLYWGVGRNGRNGCTQCCNHCDGSNITVPALVSESEGD